MRQAHNLKGAGLSTEKYFNIIFKPSNVTDRLVKDLIEMYLTGF